MVSDRVLELQGDRTKTALEGKCVVDASWSAPARLSPELRALVACARAVLDRERLEDLWVALGQCHSADKLCEAAIGHQMLGHLCRFILDEKPSGLSVSLTEQITRLQRSATLHNLEQTAHMFKILQALTSEEVEATVIKGPIWAQRLYGDVALRNWSDLDLLVRPDNVADARSLLLANGFSESKNPCKASDGVSTQIAWSETMPCVFISRQPEPCPPKRYRS